MNSTRKRPTPEEEQAQREEDSSNGWTGFDAIDEGIRRIHEEQRTFRETRFRNRSERSKREILECFRQMNVRDSQVNKIVQKMKQMLARVEKAERRDKEDRREMARISVHEARAFLKKLEARDAQ